MSGRPRSAAPWQAQGRSATVNALLAAQAVPPWPADEGSFQRALSSLAGRADQPVALDVSVPFCMSNCLCCERDIHVAQPAEVIDAYVEDLVSELSGLFRHLGAGREVLSLHLGHGTANELNQAQLARLMEAIGRHALLPAEAALTADCDPRRMGWLQTRALRAMGFRHLSFGVLDLDVAVQRAIGRAQSGALVDDVCAMARECGVETVELRLMAGLPGQTLAGWQATLQQLLAIGPERINLCRYRHHPEWVPAQRGIDEQALPGPALVQQLVDEAASMLCEAGYRWLGAELFVLDADPLVQAHLAGRLRCGLNAHTGLPPLPQLGLGVGTLGEIDGQLFGNAGTLPAWRQAVAAGRPAVTHAAAADLPGLRRRAAVERLLCLQELPRAMAEGGLEDAYARLAAFEAEGAVAVRPDHLRVTPRGRARLTELCAVFAAAPPSSIPPIQPWLGGTGAQPCS